MTSVTCITAQGSQVQLDLATLLTPARHEAALQEANQWIKRLRLVPYDGATMRERFAYRGDSLWWFTELYLHKERRLERAVAAVVALEAVREEFSPARLFVRTTDAAVGEAAAAFGRARRLPIEVTGKVASSRSASNLSLVEGLTTRMSRLRPGRRHAPRRPASVAAFVHSAFWRPSANADGPGEESYIGPVLDAVSARLPPGGLTCVGIGPRRNFRTRRWWDPILRARGGQAVPVQDLAPRAALTGSLSLWRNRRQLARYLTEGAGIRAAALVGGCDLWETLKRELEHAAILQWPWSARIMDEAGAALDALAPKVVVTYAEAGGWGRALMLEARRRNIPAVGVQHGFIYRHWLNYLHEPDEMRPLGDDRGFPLPDRTLVFDEYAAEHLRSAGQFPAAALRVTGSAKLDDLAASVEHLRREQPDSLRREFRVTDGEKLAVLATKFSEARAELPSLFAAVSTLPAVRLIVKPHPAETGELYRPFAAGIANIQIAPRDAPLARLLAAADGVVTVNSTVAIDCLILKIPALVIRSPSNLSPFVDAGAMMGANGTTTAERLHALLYDRDARSALFHRAADFVSRYHVQADGRAAERAADEILTCAI